MSKDAIDWRRVAFRAAHDAASRLETFTTDDVWESLERMVPDMDAPEGRNMGQIMQALVQHKFATPLSCNHCSTLKVIRTSRREGNKGRWDVTVYRSLVWQPPSLRLVP